MSTPPIDDTQRRALTRVGQVLRGKWRLDRLLGTGGMAAVYAATHRNGSRAAVKMLHGEASVDREVQRRFLREGYVANSIEHPGAVRVLDDDTAEDGAVFLVMELLEGETVEDRRERLGGRLSLDEVLFIADGLLDVLAAAHRKGILHRDVKPHNVFLAKGPAVRLLDFGIARARDVAPGLSMATQTGAMLGTPAFMPPEQALGHTDELDARTDLWAVGASMYYLLTGRVVHETRTLNELLVAAASKPAPSLATIAPQMPPFVVALVDRALAFDKRARFPDAASMQQALRHARAALGLPQTPPPALSVMPVRSTTPSFDPIAFGGTVSVDDATTLRKTSPRNRYVALGALGIVFSLGIGGAAAFFSMRAPSAASSAAPAAEPPQPRPAASPAVQVVTTNNPAPSPSALPAAATTPLPALPTNKLPIGTTPKTGGTTKTSTGSSWQDRQH